MKDLRDYLKPKEVELLLYNTKNRRDYLLIRIMWKTGIRVSELIDMEVNWIDFEENMINVLGKGKKWRRVPVDKETLLFIEQYMDNEKITSGRIFNISRVRVFQILREIANKVQFDKQIHPHTLRHSYAVNYLMKGGNLRNLQVNLGHSSLEVTARYLQVTAQDRKDEYSRLIS